MRSRSRRWLLLFVLSAILPLACRRPPPGAPEAAIRRLNAGIAYLEQHQFGAAGKEFEEALRIAPDYLPARIDLAIALASEVKYPEAEQELARALALDARNPHALYMKGLIHKYKGEKAEATAAFEQVHAQDPDDIDTRYNLATLYKDRGDLERAVPLFEQVIVSSPHFVSAHYALGQALLRRGQETGDAALSARGQEHIERFRKLSGGATAESAGLRYGEQGRYALALEDASPPAGFKAPPLGFVESAAARGIGFHHGAGEGPPQLLGSGVVVFDLDQDGDDDILLVGSADGAAARLYRNDGHGQFEDATEAAGLGGIRGPATAASAGDVDNDGRPDLLLAGHLLAGGEGAFHDVNPPSGLMADVLAGARATGFVDLDHDGDLDLVATFAAAPGVRTWQNDGAGHFQESTATTRIGGEGPALALTFTDYDNDRDVDAVIGGEGGVRLLSNRRDEGFGDVTRAAGIVAAAPAFGISAADVDGDGFPDLVVAGEPTTILRHKAGNQLATTQTLTPRAAAAGCLFFDADLDGDLDLAIGDRQGIRFMRNDGHGAFQEETAAVGLEEVKADVRGLAAGDLDGDGDLDLVASTYAGPALLLLNQVNQPGAPPRASWVQVVPSGLGSSKSAFGTKVEVHAAELHQKIEVKGADGYLSQSSQTVTFGLDGKQTVDRVRFLWPLGVLQAEVKLEPRQRNRVAELDRKGSSCPFLWAWDGERVQFVSDIQGGSPLGLWLAPGVHNLPDPDEWFLLPDGLAQPRDGAYDLRITESLEEIAYLDRVKLRVVDAPERLAVFPNERLLLAPPFAAEGLHQVEELRAPRAAWDADSHDVRPALIEIDRRYAGAGAGERFRGFARPWQLTLDFGTLSPAERAGKVLLVANGWVEFSNSTPIYAAAQAGLHFTLPALDLVDRRGQVASTIADAGAPAGLPKWMVLDLTGRIPADGRVLLVYRTNLEVHFDRVALGLGGNTPEPVITDLEPASAELGFGGYPTPWTPDGGRPVLYRYQPSRGDETWANQWGSYTRPGDVRELLAAEDDRLVVMTHGDEVALRFPTAALPALPPGYRRHLLLYSVGYAKDLDPHSAAPDTVGPLPFRAMTRYPYEGIGRLSSPEYLAFLGSWSTRDVRARSGGLH